MVLRLSNLLDHKFEEEDSVEIEESVREPEVYGCYNCLLIFSHDTYSISATGNSAQFCPACQDENVERLGKAPFMTRDGDDFYLMNSEGVVLGPFETQTDAQESLWMWFEKERLKNGNQESGHYKIKNKDYIRLVSIDGVSIEDGKEEGGNEDPSQEVDEASGSKETGGG